MSQPKDIFEYFNGFIDLKKTPIYNLQETVLKLWREVRQGRYHVVHGYVNWGTFDFDSHPLAVTIMTADETLLGPPEQLGTNYLTLSVETMCRIPQRKRKDGVEGIEPLIAAAMKQDIYWTMARLQEALYPDSDDNIVQRIETASGVAVDIADMGNKLQGVTFTVNLNI